MEKYFLSNEAVKTLKEFALHSPIDASKINVTSPDIQQLLKYEFIKNEIITFTEFGNYYSPDKIEYFITELGKGYLDDYQRNITSLESIKTIAESASKQAKTAYDNAKTSGRQAELSITLSIIAIIVSILSTIAQILYG